MTYLHIHKVPSHTHTHSNTHTHTPTTTIEIESIFNTEQTTKIHIILVRITREKILNQKIRSEEANPGKIEGEISFMLLGVLK